MLASSPTTGTFRLMKRRQRRWKAARRLRELPAGPLPEESLASEALCCGADVVDLGGETVAHREIYTSTPCSLAVSLPRCSQRRL